jgi:2,3-dihydroxybenzoate-AMP ligase
MLEGCTPWPDDLARRYRELGYWRGENLSDLLRGWAARSPSDTALVDQGSRVGYAELDHRVDRLAAGFRALGIGAGDRVVVQLPNGVEFVAVCFALFRIDAKPVFALLAHRADEIGHLCALSGAVGYVVPGRYRGFDYTALAGRIAGAHHGLRRVFVLDGSMPSGEAAGGRFVALAEVDAEPAPLPPPDPSDVAFFLLSGGTTALPKLIPRTHDDYAYQLRAAAELLGLGPRDAYLAVLPVEFNFAWGCPGVLGTLAAGGRVVLSDTQDPHECFAMMAQEQVTFTSLVPTLAQLWLEAAADLGSPPSSLRLVQIGGAPLSRVVAERVGPTFGCSLQQVFGMAEGLLTFTRDTDPAETVLGTQGRPLSPGDELRVVDAEDQPVGPGETGELLTRGPYTLRGYYNAPEHNARAFTGDGFYRTGDLARLTEDGSVVISGRVKDVIIRGGNKISAAEVEGHLLTMPGVHRAAVVGVPDAYLGERICACLTVAGDPPTLPTVRSWLLGRGIASYKLPDLVLVTPELPLTGLGKVDKHALVERAAGVA